MATLTTPTHRFTYDDVVKMYEVGILAHELRVEVLDGQVIELPPPGPRHDTTATRLTRRFARGLPDEYELRPGLVLRLPDGDFVLPDIMVVDAEANVETHPTGAHLIIEIAHSSQAHDRRKADRYAAVGVTEYWIADRIAQVVVVHRDPRPDGYATVTEHPGGTLVPLLGVPAVPVAELLD